MIIVVFWIFTEISEGFEKNRLEKPFSPVKWNACLYTFTFKILLSGVSLSSGESPLYFHDEEILKQGRLCQKFWKLKLERNVVGYLVDGKILRKVVIKFEVAENKLSLLIKNNIMCVKKYSY